MLPPSSSSSNAAASVSNGATFVNGRLSAPGVGIWTDDEHKRFRAAIEKYPNGPWSAVAEFVGTRTVRQTMTHAQKCRQRLERHARGLKPAGRKRRASQSEDQSNDSTVATSSSEPSLSGTFEVLDIAELQAPTDPIGSIDATNFDWVLPYLSSPDWIDTEPWDGQTLELFELEP